MAGRNSGARDETPVRCGRFAVSGWPRDELVEARADFILAGVPTAEAYAEHFEAQMHAGTFEVQMRLGKVRKLLAPLRVFRRKGVLLLAVVLAPIGLLGYAAATTDTVPVMFSGANEVAAVNTASGRLGAVTPLPAPPGAVSAADGSVWVADPAARQLAEIDPVTGSVERTLPVDLQPSAIAAAGQAIWVAGYDTGTVEKLAPASGCVLARIRVGAGPAALAVGA